MISNHLSNILSNISTYTCIFMKKDFEKRSISCGSNFETSVRAVGEDHDIKIKKNNNVCTEEKMYLHKSNRRYCRRNICGILFKEQRIKNIHRNSKSPLNYILICCGTSCF